MKYDVLLFDADDTLLDFKKSEAISFQMVLTQNGIEGNFDILFESYKQINHVLWNQHAEGLVAKDFLVVERFRKFLEVNHLKASPNKMSEDYSNTLSDHVFLIEGTLELLNNLHKKIPMIIVTNGVGFVQHKRLHSSGLKSFIDLMVVSEECGFSKPDKRIFHYTFERLKISCESSRILMIGDKLETDILGANNVGIDSCWFNPEKSNNATNIVPTYEIQNITEVLGVL
ncbi:MAG: YjjG family noncanonical pyrimidine nucleotidase [Bacteriovorax sp.]